MTTKCEKCGWKTDEKAPDRCLTCGNDLNDDWMLFLYTRNRPRRRNSCLCSTGRHANPGGISLRPDQVIPVRICSDVDAMHMNSSRAYAHTYCAAPPTICVASAFFSLPNNHRDGILAHELGHLFAGRAGDERDADQAFFDKTGVRIRYADGKWGACLQSLEKDDSRRLLGKFKFDFSGTRDRKAKTKAEHFAVVYRVAVDKDLVWTSTKINEAQSHVDDLRESGFDVVATAFEIGVDGSVRELAWSPT